MFQIKSSPRYLAGINLLLFMPAMVRFVVLEECGVNQYM
jgi:hypothetical protein